MIRSTKDFFKNVIIGFAAVAILALLILMAIIGFIIHYFFSTAPSIIGVCTVAALGAWRYFVRDAPDQWKTKFIKQQIIAGAIGVALVVAGLFLRIHYDNQDDLATAQTSENKSTANELQNEQEDKLNRMIEQNCGEKPSEAGSLYC
jgi:thiol:disulfide interchange protein